MKETEILKHELEHYKSEKERIRKIIGQIGGNTSKRKDTIINIIFLFIILFLFTFDLVREIMNFPISWLPQSLSIEIAVLLVSLKIIWMIHKQSKIDHFQFWVLNSIEFQINSISKKVNTLESKIDKLNPEIGKSDKV